MEGYAGKSNPDIYAKTASAMAASYGGCAPAATSTLSNAVSVLVARTESNEYTANRIAGRLFGSQPSNGAGCNVSTCVVETLESEVDRASRSADRLREVLEQLEAHLG